MNILCVGVGKYPPRPFTTNKGFGELPGIKYLKLLSRYIIFYITKQVEYL